MLDTALARELVALLQAEQPLSKADAVIEYTHDDYFDEQDYSTPIVRVMPGELNHTRLTRANWITESIVQIVIAGNQQMNTTAESPDAQTEIDEWLAFVDEIIELVKSIKPLSKPAKSVAFSPRLDRDRLRHNNTFVTTALVAYSLGE